MTRGSIGLLAIGVVMGFAIGSLLPRDRESEALQPLKVVAPSTTHSTGTTSTGDLEARISALVAENETLRSQVAGSSPRNTVPRTPAELIKDGEVMRKQRFAAALKRETDQLLAAGFPLDRIESIRRLSEEVEARRRQLDVERFQKGLPPDEMAMAYQFDPDLDLKDEIGERDYENYRRALGRPMGVEVLEALRGGAADISGLKAGDVILSYDGKRVYNMAQIDAIARKKGSLGETTIVDVRRDGVEMRLVVPKGPLGIRFPPPVPHTMSRPL
jgi:hypothetical protein